MPLRRPNSLPMPAQLHRVDTARLTLRECWYQTRSANVIVLWFLKLLRIRMPVPPISPSLYLRLGVVPEETSASPNVPRALSAAGSVRMKDGRLSLPYLTFREPAVGPAALVVWL